MSIGFTPEFAAAMRREVEAMRAAKVAELAAGLADDYPNYRFRCGQISALEAVLETIEGIRKSLMEG